jgi:hypothetical protein
MTPQRCHFVEAFEAAMSGSKYIPGFRNELRSEVDDLENTGG